MAHAILMDVHVPSAVTEGLRRRGVDVRTAQEERMERASDEQLLQHATELDRLLFSQDEDLLVIAARCQRESSAFLCLIYAPQLAMGVGGLIEDLELLAKCARVEELRNQVIHLPLR